MTIPFSGEARVALVVALGWTLLHFLWQGAVVAALFAAVNAALRRASAEARYAAGAAALLLMLALPVTTFVTLASRPAPDAAPGSEVLAARTEPVSVTTPVVTAAPAVRGPAPRAPRGLDPWFPLLISVWALGVAALSLRLALGWVAATRLRTTGVTLAAERWQRTTARLAERLRVRAVRLYESARVEVPAVVGWLKPVILVPPCALTGLTPAQVEAVLAHELAHIRRHDFLANLVQHLVETLLFYHPAVWWISGRVRLERENCCDDLAIAVCGDPVGYARALAELEAARAPLGGLAMAANGGSLFHRIARLARRAPHTPADPPLWMAPVVALATLAGLAALTGWAESEPRGPARAAVAAAKHVVREGGEIARHAANRVREAVGTAPLAEAGAELARARDELTGAGRDLAQAGRALRESGASLEDALAALKLDDTADGAAPEGSAGLGDLARRALALLDGRALPALRGEPALPALPALPASPAESAGPVLADEPSGTLDEDELLELAEAGITPRRYREFEAMGVTSAREIATLTRHGVSLDYVRRLRARGFGFGAEEIARLHNHGVNAGTLEQLHDLGYGSLPVADLIELSSHGVAPGYLAAMKWLGFEQLPVRAVIEMRSHDVQVEDVARFRLLGYGDLAIPELIRLRQFGVTPEYAGRMRRAFGERLPAETLVRLSQYGVAPEFAAGVRRLGRADMPVEDVIRLSQHGVTLEWLSGIAMNGYQGLPASDLLALHQQDVDGPFLEECRDAGYRKLSVSAVVRLRQLGVVPRAAEEDDR